MRFSLVIATLGRTVELARLLNSLCAQSYQNFEVLIADQNPEGFLDATLAPYADKLKLQRLRVTPRGVSAARNALLPLMTGEVIAFPDDDCWYAPDTLLQVADFFAAKPAVGGIFGVWGHAEDALELKAVQDQKPAPMTLHQLFRRGETYVQFYRLAVVDAVGGFDEELGPGTGLPWGGGEDTDYALRALQQAPVWKVPTVRLFHPLQDKKTVNKKKLAFYAAGRMRLLKKHRFPLWFQLANVLYPLWMCVKDGGKDRVYRWHMFSGRLRGFIKA